MLNNFKYNESSIQQIKKFWKINLRELINRAKLIKIWNLKICDIFNKNIHQFIVYLLMFEFRLETKECIQKICLASRMHKVAYY